MPMIPLRLILMILVLAFLLALLQVGAISLAFDKLGLSMQSGLTLLFSCLLGSAINLPLFRIHGPPPEEAEPRPDPMRQWLRLPPVHYTGKTTIAVNVGGCLIPVTFSLYLLGYHHLSLINVLLAIASVSAVAYGFSRPLPGIGIGMPVLVAPVSAALVALLIDPVHAPPLAYVGGTLGVLIGADLLRLKDVRQLATPTAAIGGAGTFDGIFLTGLVAVLLT